MTTLDQAVKEAVANAGNTVIGIVGLELIHSLFPDDGSGANVIRYVQHDTDVTFHGKLFIGIGMEGAMPPVGTEPGNELTIRLDSVERSFQYYVNLAIERNEVIDILAHSIVYDVKTEQVIGVARSVAYQVKRVQYDLASATIVAGATEPSNMKIPVLRYLPSSHPALYR